MGMKRAKKEIIAMFQNGVDVFLENGRDSARREGVKNGE
jgi:hypothetical protein